MFAVRHYFGMFFILVYGWDGLGYDRFFYDRDMVAGSPAWTPGVGTGGTILGTAEAAWHFITSSVALTLYLDEVFIGSCMTNIGHFRAAANVNKGNACFEFFGG